MSTLEELRKQMIYFAEEWQEADTQAAQEFLLQHFGEAFLCIAMDYLME